MRPDVARTSSCCGCVGDDDDEEEEEVSRDDSMVTFGKILCVQVNRVGCLLFDDESGPVRKFMGGGSREALVSL